MHLLFTNAINKYNDRLCTIRLSFDPTADLSMRVKAKDVRSGLISDSRSRRQASSVPASGAIRSSKRPSNSAHARRWLISAAAVLTLATLYHATVFAGP